MWAAQTSLKLWAAQAKSSTSKSSTDSKFLGAAAEDAPAQTGFDDAGAWVFRDCGDRRGTLRIDLGFALVFDATVGGFL